MSKNLTKTDQLIVQDKLGIGSDTIPTTQLTIRAATDLPIYGSEFLSADGWTSTGWTGDWATGWVHTAGNTSVLSYPTAAVVGVKYQISFTITGCTAGSISLGFGGDTYLGKNLTGSWGPTATTVGNLTVTPASNFDGKVVISIKAITDVSSPINVVLNSSSAVVSETRAGSDSTYPNILIGKNAGSYTTTGWYNVALGLDALSQNTTGGSNVAVGSSSLRVNTVGYGNTSIGATALFTNSTGRYNTALGAGTLYSNTTGCGNSAIGINSLFYNTTGLGNVSLGNNALFGNSTGSLNLALGYIAGRYIADGVTSLTDPENSIYIGYNAKGLSNADDNTIVIGHLALGKGANTVVLGNDSITSTTLKGDVSITTVELGAETLTNPNLTGGTSWAATNDCTLASDKATWAFATGSASTLTQTAATLAIPGVGSKWYRFDYTVSGNLNTMPTSPSATITTTFAKVAVPLLLANGPRTVYFESAVSPTDFVISSTLSGIYPTFSLDNLSLKQVTSDGDFRVPSTKAALDIYSTTKGFLSPRLTTTQRDAITSPPEGLEIYNLTEHQKEFYDGSNWVSGGLVDNSVTTAKIAYNAVTANQIADNAVITRHILDNNVTETKIADNAVITRHILANNVTEPKIADNAVITRHVLDSNITEVKIASNAVTSGKIAFNAVGTDQIAANAVTQDKVLFSSLLVGAGPLDAKAIFQCDSTTKGSLSPRMTTTQRDAITSVPEGLEIYNLTLHQKEYFNATSWVGGGSSPTYVTTTDITSDGTGDLADAIAAKNLCSYVILENTTANPVTVNVGTTAGGSDLASAIVMGDSELYTIVVDKVFSSSVATHIYISSLSWNSANLTANVNCVRVMA
jgi:hypothetical protein